MRRAALPIALAALLAGCGNERTPVPDVTTPDAPRGERRVDLDDAGVRFDAPANWPDLARRGTRAGGIQSRTATVAVWRYPRAEPLPVTPTALEQAERALVERIRARDRTFRLRSSRVTTIGGERAIEIVGRQTMAGLPFDVRSAHVFAAGAEVVVDAYAPPGGFARVDRAVFRPLLGSLRVGAP